MCAEKGRMTQLRKARREATDIAESQTRREKSGCGGGEERERGQALLERR